MTTLKRVKPLINDDGCFQLYDSSQDISNHVAEYIVHKAHKTFRDCCGRNFLQMINETSSTSYSSILLRGGLKSAPEDLNDAVAKSFAILYASSTAIRCCDIPSIKRGLTILEKFVDVPRLTCEKHQQPFS